MPAPRKAQPRGAKTLNAELLVRRVQVAESGALAELYALVNSATRYYLASVLEAQDINDKIHDTFLATLQAIRRRGLEQPDRLRAFIVTIAHRQFAAHVARAVRERRLFSEGTGSEMFRPDPAQNAEQRLIASEKQRMARQALQTLS